MENKNVGQVLPDNRKNFVENDSCVVGPEQPLLRTSALFNNTPSSVPTGQLPPHGEVASFNVLSSLSRSGVNLTMSGKGHLNQCWVNTQPTKGFTLIELLVVVLIIGILAAVALPQYQKAVERARMAEAVANVRSIAQAHQVYYLTHGNYLTDQDMEKLDITIPGGKINGKRILTKDFYYAPSGIFDQYLATANRWDGKHDLYFIVIRRDSPSRIRCGSYDTASIIQKELCRQLNATGVL